MRVKVLLFFFIFFIRKCKQKKRKLRTRVEKSSFSQFESAWRAKKYRESNCWTGESLKDEHDKTKLPFSQKEGRIRFFTLKWRGWWNRGCSKKGSTLIFIFTDLLSCYVSRYVLWSFTPFRFLFSRKDWVLYNLIRRHVASASEWFL